MIGEDVRAAVAAELQACETRVRALLQASTALSEREVFAIGASIAKMNKEAVGNLDTLNRLSEEFQSGDVQGRASLEATIQAQTKALSAFTVALDEGLLRQRAATAGIVDVARQIQKFVTGIGVVAVDLRMLTLNAKLEASRWGAQGGAFATVAAGMRELTSEVQRVNEQIGALAETLSAHTTQIVESEESMHVLSEQLAENAARQMGEMRRAYEKTRSSTALAVATGTERANQLVALSTGMLTNLQFQDRMAQTLMEIDRVVSLARIVTDELLGCISGDGEGTGGAEIDVRAVLESARQKAGVDVVRISLESELSSSDRTMSAGVVELF